MQRRHYFAAALYARMYTETEGIVLRQTKTAGGRRMITVLTKRYGKISAGTSINEGGKNKSALALRPFSYGRYDLFKNKDNYNINGAEALQSFFSIGEDMERYMNASYVLELTERLLPEEQPSPAYFILLLDFLGEIEKRKKSFETLTIAFQLKMLSLAGCAPLLKQCSRCGKESEEILFSVTDGGILCKSCVTETDCFNPMVFTIGKDMIQALSYMESRPLQSLEKLALNPELAAKARKIMKAYISHHLGIDNLKSEGLII